MYRRWDSKLSRCLQDIRVGIVGTGPAAIYTAKYLKRMMWPQTLYIDFLDQYSLPCGLLRYGVAPDHPEMRNAIHEFERLDPNQKASNVRFFGQVKLASSLPSPSAGDIPATLTAVTLEQMKESFHAILLAVGAQTCSRLSIPGSSLKGIVAAGDVAKWYNGFTVSDIDGKNPTSATFPRGEKNFLKKDLLRRLHFLDDGNGDNVNQHFRSHTPVHLVIIGHGNVALDISRMFTKTLDDVEIHPQIRSLIESLSIQSVDIIGRRGLLDASFSPSELREMLSLNGVTVMVDPKEVPPLKRNSPVGRREKKMTDIFEMMATNWRALVDNEPKPSSKLVRILSHRIPAQYVGDKDGWVEGVNFSDTSQTPSACNGAANTESRATTLVIESVGFQQSDIGLSLTMNRKAIQNVDGRVQCSGDKNQGTADYPIYVVGWCRGGARGTIASVIPDAIKIAETMKADFDSGKWISHGQEKIDIRELIKSTLPT